MGARVRIRGEWVEHPEAKMIDVKDGHLHVYGQGSGVQQLHAYCGVHAGELAPR